jgi:hypothetical protein
MILPKADAKRLRVSRKSVPQRKSGAPLDALLATHETGKDARLDPLLEHYGRDVGTAQAHGVMGKVRFRTRVDLRRAGQNPAEQQTGREIILSEHAGAAGGEVAGSRAGGSAQRSAVRKVSRPILRTAKRSDAS